MSALPREKKHDDIAETIIALKNAEVKDYEAMAKNLEMLNPVEIALFQAALQVRQVREASFNFGQICEEVTKGLSNDARKKEFEDNMLPALSVYREFGLPGTSPSEPVVPEVDKKSKVCTVS